MHRRLISLARNSLFALTVTLLAGFLGGLLIIGQSYLISNTINAVFIEKQTLAQIAGWMRLLLLVIITRGAFIWINELAANRVAERVKADLRNRLFTHILELGPSYTRSERTGELTTAAIQGIESLDAYFSQYLPQLIISILVPVSILILVFPLDPISGFILLITAPLIPFFMYMIGRDTEVVTKRQYETLNRLSAHFLDSLQGLTTLKLFGQSKAQIQNIAKVSNQFRDLTLKVLQVTFLSAFALELLATLSTALIAVEVGLRLLYGHMEFREALFLLILAPEFYLPLRMLGQRFHAGMAGTAAARQIFEILDIPSDERKEPVGNISAREQPGRSNPLFVSLNLSNLSYKYPGEETLALENVSLTLKAGEHIALIGSSGAGKTTLVYILLRFIKPTQGQIFLNGESITTIPFNEWHELVSWVGQNPYLFQGTISANICLGKPAASFEEVKAAAHAAHMDDFIESLPQKYESFIGEGGARLSKGQAQRLALARVFLTDSPILILDEPTSSLDPETEEALEESTLRLMSSRTVITIAHRLTTVFKADQIIVLDKGRIIESGTHNELLDRNGEYLKLIHAFEMSQTAVFEQTHLPPRKRGISNPFFLPTNNVSLYPTPSNKRKGSLLSLLSFLNGSYGWVFLSILFGSLTVGSSIALMGSSAWLISTAALHPSIAVLEVAIVGVRFFGIARACFRYFERLISHNVTFRLLSKLRVWFFEKLEPLAPARLLDFRAGDLLARITGDIDTLENFYVRAVAPPLTAIFIAIGTCLFLAFFDTRLSLLLLGFYLILGLVLPMIAQIMSRVPGRNFIIQRGELEEQIVDGIQGLTDITAFGRGSDRAAQIGSAGNKLANIQRRLAQVSGFHSGLYAFLTSFAVWLILVDLIPQVASGHLNGVVLASFALLSQASFEAFLPLPLAAQIWSSTRQALHRLLEVLDSKPAVQDPEETETELQSKLNVVNQINDHKIQLEDLSFTYPGSDSPALQHITFTLETGRSIALVGPSGAGKSTLANLLVRFWDYSSGEIRLNGTSLRNYKQDDVRQRIALISQPSYFFNTTIYENLRMARRGVTQEEIESATVQAQIYDFIESLPKSFETVIGEQGQRLSSGERQRLAIARAIIKNAPILILDEPTANLDALIENRILGTLFGLMRHKTTILITHRLLGLDKTNEILVMDQGLIVDRGIEMELLNHNGLYRRLYDLQNRIFVAA